MPLYFDRGKTKGGVSGKRYAAYSKATTLAEYLARNDPKWQSPDFKYDYIHGHLRLLPSRALMSINPRELNTVLAHSPPVPDMPLPVEACVTRYVQQVMLASTELGLIPDDSTLGLSTGGSTPTQDGVWAPCNAHPALSSTGFSPDALHDRAQRLGPIDPAMGTALSIEALDPGACSPPQVGGEHIDELTTFGYAVHRQASFSGHVTASATRDRDLSAATPDAHFPFAVLSSLDPHNALSDGCAFIPGRDAGFDTEEIFHPEGNFDLSHCNLCRIGISAF